MEWTPESIEDREKWQAERRRLYDEYREARDAERVESSEQGGQHPTHAPGWLLTSPIHAEVRVGDFIVEAEVRHGLGDHPIRPPDYPEVVAVKRVARADGRPLGAQPITLDLSAVALDVVVQASRFVLVPNADGVYGRKDGWKEAAIAIRRLAVDLDGGFNWTNEKHEWLMDVWRHVHETRHGNQKDIAQALGLATKTVSNRLVKLRRRWGEEKVPLGRPGREKKSQGEPS